MPVAIQHPKDPKRPTVIRDDLYDPARHVPWQEPVQDYLPDDLPGRAALVSAGFVTMHGVEACEDFGDVPGIGEATEARLLTYLGRTDAPGESPGPDEVTDGDG